MSHRRPEVEAFTPKRKLSVFYRSFDVIDPEMLGPPEVRRSSSSPSVQAESEGHGEGHGQGHGPDEKKPDGAEEEEEKEEEVVVVKDELREKMAKDDSNKEEEYKVKVGVGTAKVELGILKPEDTRSKGKLDVKRRMDPKKNLIGNLKETLMDNLRETLADNVGERWRIVEVDRAEVRNIPRVKDSRKCRIPEGKPVKTTSDSHTGNSTAEETTENSMERKIEKRTEYLRNVEKLESLRKLGYFGKLEETTEKGKYFSSTSSSSSSPEHEAFSKEEQRTTTGQPRTDLENGTRFGRANYSELTTRNASRVRTGSSSSETDEEEVEEEKTKGQAKVEERQSKEEKETNAEENRVQAKRAGMKRSLSEGNSLRGQETGNTEKQEEEGIQAFPSFPEKRLNEAGLASLPDVDDYYRENIPEDELERKYTAFSIGLGTDRITLTRRLGLAVHLRDLAEKNLATELEKMMQEIHELWPLYTDRDSIEKVERVERRAEMVARCAQRISVAAETLGATRQEQRVSRAILIADKYLQLLRASCENLTAELAQTKRILLKNNIVLEESSVEFAEDLPRIRYRSSTPSNNRTMDGPRQRNSVSGRVTIRRPSFSTESRPDIEKLHVNDNSGMEFGEDGKCQVEENNNLPRLESRRESEETAQENWQRSQDIFPAVETEEKIDRGKKNFPTDLQAWHSLIRSLGIFFLGYLANNLISTMAAD